MDLGRLKPRCEVRDNDAGVVEPVRLIGGRTEGKGGKGGETRGETKSM